MTWLNSYKIFTIVIDFQEQCYSAASHN